MTRETAAAGPFVCARPSAGGGTPRPLVRVPGGVAQAPGRRAGRRGGRSWHPAPMDIGKIGIWTSYRRFGSERAGEAAKVVEELGFRAWWLGSSPKVDDVRPILEATSTLVA